MADTTYNPQQPSNLNTTATNQTTRYFNNFFLPQNTVSSNTNDAIVSFFEQQSGNAESARLLAQAVIDTAFAQREDPLDVLDQFRNLTNNELNAFLALYLNTSRVPTSFLGLQSTARTSPYVSRTILT
jgi:hypothetical protein